MFPLQQCMAKSRYCQDKSQWVIASECNERGNLITFTFLMYQRSAMKFFSSNTTNAL